MTRLKVCCVVLGVVALPFAFQATTGCGFNGVATGTQPEGMSYPNSYLCSCTCNSPDVFLKEFRVLASEDDAEQKVADNTVDITSTDLDFSSARLVGMRFQGVDIPPGATIMSATIQFAASTAGTGTVTFRIKAQAINNAPAFSAVVNNISARTLTSKFVDWTPPNWNPAAIEVTPNFAAVLQDVVNGPGWAEGNSVVLVVTQVSGTGARHAQSRDGSSALTPVLSVDYQNAADMIGPQDLPVCMLETQNPNLNGGVIPSEATLKTDCGRPAPGLGLPGRVEATLTGLAEACGYPSNCSCAIKPGSEKFAKKCNDTCVENTVDANCADFDPVHGPVQATNAPGDQPVCLTNSPMSQGLYGRRTRCAVNGSATVKVDDEDPDDPPSASGILEFLGTPCPGGSCPVGIEYRLDITPVTFSDFFSSETFDQLAGLGKNIPGHEASISMTGDGMFMPGTTEVSGRGHREDEDEQLAFATNNSSDIHINVKFGSMSPTCALNGTLLGGSVDPEAKRCDGGDNANAPCNNDEDCESDSCKKLDSAALELGLNLAGQILNQPPTADRGNDQTIECTDADGTEVTLDGTGSSDLDNNIKLFSWRRGSRVGPEVGTDAVSMVLQPLGSESYVLRVIDAYGQTDEDTTMVDITDTTPPEVSCGVAKHVLEILNHNLVNVGLAASAEDQCEGTLPINVKVFGDEDDQVNTGNGVFSPDAKNFGVGTLRLRAERKDSGNGRVYLIVVDASDSSGNRSFDCCTVIVPRSPRLQASLQSAENQARTAQNFCLARDGTAPAGYHVIGDGPVIGLKQ